MDHRPKITDKRIAVACFVVAVLLVTAVIFSWTPLIRPLLIAADHAKVDRFINAGVPLGSTTQQIIDWCDKVKAQYIPLSSPDGFLVVNASNPIDGLWMGGDVIVYFTIKSGRCTGHSITINMYSL